MWWMLTAFSTAEVGGSSTCAPGIVVGFRPAPGSTVPPDVTVQVAFEGECGAPAVWLEDDLGVMVAARQTFFPSLALLEPVEPLAPGVYAVMANTYGVYPEPLGTFTVAADAAPPPPPPPPVDVFVDATRSCESALTSRVQVTARFEPDPDGWGILALDLVTESGLQDTIELLWYGQDPVEVGASLFGGREVCVTPRMLDASGAETWAGEAVCAPPFEGCPLDEAQVQDDAAGCGCATPVRGGGWLLAALLPALARRRRSRQG